MMTTCGMQISHFHVAKWEKSRFTCDIYYQVTCGNYVKVADMVEPMSP